MLFSIEIYALSTKLRNPFSVNDIKEATPVRMAFSPVMKTTYYLITTRFTAVVLFSCI